MQLNKKKIIKKRMKMIPEIMQFMIINNKNLNFQIVYFQ